jgi:uncharacterized damage-inducible protein DinB
MFLRYGRTALALAAVVACAAPVAAQQAPASAHMGDMINDLKGVQKKFTALAKAFPADKMDYRPMAGVRSVREVLLHAASDNYLMPSMVGTPMPAETKLSSTDFKTFDAYEKQNMNADAIVATIDKSFDHMFKTMNAVTDADLDKKMKFFGRETSNHGMWVGTTTHLHEHLGQLIAYARANGVKPPWSN